MLFIGVFITPVTGLLYGQQKETAYDICLKTFETTKSLKSISYTMYKEERIDGKMKKQVSNSILTRSPYRVYVKQLAPKKGIEVLYSSVENPEKALINPNGFPWINLSLDPYGSTMRKGQHHTVKDGGFDLVISILEYLFDKYGERAKDKLIQEKDVIYDKISCYKIVFDNPDFKYITYTAKKGETITSIAQKFRISEYMIMQKNKGVGWYDDVVEGKKIIIPNDYSPRMELLIDKKRLIPLSIKVFDDQGLYEYYRYSNVVLNPSLSDKDFDRDNASYNF